MIISSKHHDLIEQFESANKAEGAAIKALNDYLNIPNYNKNIYVKLSQQMDEAHNNTMAIYNQIQEIKLDR